MAEQDGGMVGEIDAGLTLSRDIRFEDPLCQKPICAKSGRPFVWLEDDADHDCNQASLSPSWEASEVKILRRGSGDQAGGSSEGVLSIVLLVTIFNLFYLAARDHVDHIQSQSILSTTITSNQSWYPSCSTISGSCSPYAACFTSPAFLSSWSSLRSSLLSSSGAPVRVSQRCEGGGFSSCLVLLFSACFW